MSRKREFKGTYAKPPKSKDPRFGLREVWRAKRQLIEESPEKPSIKSYARPGKGVSGEHQN